LAAGPGVEEVVLFFAAAVLFQEEYWIFRENDLYDSKYQWCSPVSMRWVTAKIEDFKLTDVWLRQEVSDPLRGYTNCLGSSYLVDLLVHALRTDVQH